MSQFEQGPHAFPLGHRKDEPEIVEPKTTRQQLVSLDLGVGEFDLDKDLGPSRAEEESYFAEVGGKVYIDTRPSKGVHCMDDRVRLPGVQLPGGVIENFVAGQLMRPSVPGTKPITVGGDYQQFSTTGAFRPGEVWVHGESCAAAELKRQALIETANHDSDAFEFTGTILEHMNRRFDRLDITRPIFVGYEKSQDSRVWDMRHENGWELVSASRDVGKENFVTPHRVAGLRVDLTGNLFNSARFKDDHDGCGVLSVTLGAWKDKLAEMGYDERTITRELIQSALFTYGVAKAAGHQYLRAGIVVPESD